MADVVKPDNEMIPLGLHLDIPNEVYHRSPGISNSGLSKIRQSGLTYWFERRNPKPRTEEMYLGDAFHVLVLEPKKFEEKYVKSEFKSFQSDAAKEYRENMKALGKTIIRSNPGICDIWQPSDWDRIHRMRDGIMANSLAFRLLDQNSGDSEVSGYWIDKHPITKTGKLCKIRMDRYNTANNVIVDLKSAVHAGITDFNYHVDKFRYNVQNAWYVDGMAAMQKPVNNFYFVVIEKNPPYQCCVYTLDPRSIAKGRMLYRHDLVKYAEYHNKYKETKADDSWPGYEAGPYNAEHCELEYINRFIPQY